MILASGALACAWPLNEELQQYVGVAELWIYPQTASALTWDIQSSSLARVVALFFD